VGKEVDTGHLLLTETACNLTLFAQGLMAEDATCIELKTFRGGDSLKGGCGEKLMTGVAATIWLLQIPARAFLPLLLVRGAQRNPPFPLLLPPLQSPFLLLFHHFPVEDRTLMTLLLI